MACTWSNQVYNVYLGPQLGVSSPWGQPILGQKPGQEFAVRLLDPHGRIKKAHVLGLLRQ